MLPTPCEERCGVDSTDLTPRDHGPSRCLIFSFVTQSMGSSESCNAANARLRLEALLIQGTGSSRSPCSGQRLLIAVKWLWYLILVEDKAFLDGPNTLAQLYPIIGLVQSYQSYAALRATGVPRRSEVLYEVFDPLCPVGIPEAVRCAGAGLRRVDHGGSEPSLQSRTTRYPRSVTPRSLSCWFQPSRVPMRDVSSNSPLASSNRVRRANFA